MLHAKVRIRTDDSGATSPVLNHCTAMPHAKVSSACVSSLYSADTMQRTIVLYGAAGGCGVIYVVYDDFEKIVF